MLIVSRLSADQWLTPFIIFRIRYQSYLLGSHKLPFELSFLILRRKDEGALRVIRRRLSLKLPYACDNRWTARNGAVVDLRQLRRRQRRPWR